MKADERALLLAVYGGEPPRDAAWRLNVAPKRADYIFRKWSSKGYYEYGVTSDRGWLTDAGDKLAERLDAQS